LLLKTGTVVDATLIAAPTSTKNKDNARDPDMHSSKKGDPWYFGMKAHIGADAESGLVHTVRGTSGHVSNIAEANTLLHGEESMAVGDAGYQGVEKRPDAKAGVRAKVEHPFRVIKRQFGFVKVRYRGLKKNTAQLFTLVALSNLWMVRSKLMGAGA
jgi:IS5 family transposase